MSTQNSASKNSLAFSPGDLVRVVSGKHKNYIGRIVMHWESGFIDEGDPCENHHEPVYWIHAANVAKGEGLCFSAKYLELLFTL